MALHIINSKSRVTKSRDSSWQEWLDEEEYVYDDEVDKIFHIKSEVFENTRRPAQDWKKTISKNEILPIDLPKELQQKLDDIKDTI